jgi:hypothetical protein
MEAHIVSLTYREVKMDEIDELEHARLEAESLCMALYNKHYRDDSPDFEMLDTVGGIISQISNMTSDMVRR